MSLNDKQESFRQSVLNYTEKWLKKEYIEYAEKKNVKAAHEELIRLNHWNHILKLMSDPDLDEENMYILLALAKEKIAEEKDDSLQITELVKINLIGTHTSAWNIAHFHYERAIKTLCMMMVTLMDYIIQEQGGESVLYQNLDTSKYFNLLDEITILNEDYRNDYFSICSFDFCTKKLGKYVDVPEYADIAKEHNRVINNGNPERVKTVMNRLKEICGENRKGVFTDIEKAYTPQPSYSEKIFESCYQEALQGYGTEEMAMSDFSGLVAKVNMLYRLRLKK